MKDQECMFLDCLNGGLSCSVITIFSLRLLSPLLSIQACCLLYQTFKPAVSSIKYSRLLFPLKYSSLLSPLSNIYDGSLLSQTYKAALSSIKHSRLLSPQQP
jgi:hypothetical protein